MEELENRGATIFIIVEKLISRGFVHFWWLWLDMFTT